MSMTREEAIANREDCLKYLEGCGPMATPECVEAVRWSVNALKALRPVSRWQVEQVWRGEWKIITTHNGCTPDQDCVCSRCGASGIPNKAFCDSCGAPMTDEAVDILLGRLEALKDDSTTD